MKKSFSAEMDDYRACVNCLYAREVIKDQLLVCKKRGSVSQNSVCRRFKLDLLALRPRKARSASSSFSEDDFTL